MRIGALVLVADSVPACVCEPIRSDGSLTEGGAAATAGYVVIAAQQQQQLQQQQQANTAAATAR